MRVAVTGANGFIGQNLCLKLSENEDIEILYITRDTVKESLFDILKKADFIFHLAGVNRPKNEEEFKIGNTDLTKTICDNLIDNNLSTPIVYASSTQAELDNPYGISKREAENIILKYSEDTDAKVYIYRLPNVFGKWCKPNYNSAVATFAYNISRGLPINIVDPSSPLNLVYIDDVFESFINLLDSKSQPGFQTISPIYETSVGKVAELLKSFKDCRDTLLIEKVGTGFIRALYATYVSYLDTSNFSYEVEQHIDPRGTFVEMLKTPDAGQFSFFTAHPGITRGEHYHHTKTEKFLVIKGTAKFGFRHVVTNETFELITDGSLSKIVETVPGWTHDITNIGEEELIVMLWANEIFDREKPDTKYQKVKP